MFRKQASRTTLILCFAGLMLIASGCGPMAGWLAALFKGPEKIKAVYEPPKDKKILVFVDDLANPLSYEPIKRALSEKLSKLLVENKVAAEVVDYEQLLNLSMADEKFNQLGAWNIGRKLGADIVVFIEVKSFHLREKEYEDTELWQGSFGTEVRVIDCNAPKDNVRLWPTDREKGFPVGPLETEPQDDSSAHRGVSIANELAEKMADKIDKLFHDHEVETKFGE